MLSYYGCLSKGSRPSEPPPKAGWNSAKWQMQPAEEYEEDEAKRPRQRARLGKA